LELVLQ